FTYHAAQVKCSTKSGCSPASIGGVYLSERIIDYFDCHAFIKPVHSATQFNHPKLCSPKPAKKNAHPERSRPRESVCLLLAATAYQESEGTNADQTNNAGFRYSTALGTAKAGAAVRKRIAKPYRVGITISFDLRIQFLPATSIAEVSETLEAILVPIS
ncbi:MAG: hypothetical protein WB870_06675, partial [Gallionellaceae bacterium]